jgi:hypothetical protein
LSPKRHRLFHQGRNSGRNAFEAVDNVELIGGRDDNTIGLFACHQVSKAGGPSDAQLLGDCLCPWRGIDDSHEFRLWLGCHMLNVPFADEAGTKDC